MALAKNVMQGGFSAGQAKAANGNSIGPTLTAAGTTISDALQLTADVCVVTTATASQGVKLFNGEIGDDQWVYNATTATIYVYPPSALISINQLAVGSGFLLPSYTGAVCKRFTSTKMTAILSA